MVAAQLQIGQIGLNLGLQAKVIVLATRLE
jgi:hypothetical protein